MVKQSRSLGGSMGGLATLALTAGFTYSDYRNRVNEGESPTAALAKAGAMQALWMVPGMTPILLAGMAGDMLKGSGSMIASAGGAQAAKQGKAYKANFGGNYFDTQNAYTMRQRGTQAISNNQMNVRSVLGSEARTLYRYANGQ